ncbi:MAG: UDP-3-O-(3-hydroxymyristoyl)glucosamine N-acyltransferase [Gemmatimonadales bacterium]|nr:UDP-3-O-(3-hydroxymyristoyl)glucosamine N-acyltransferase [Gemmatimonadales bacterium]
MAAREVNSQALTAQAVADLVGGRLLGEGETLLTGVGPIDRAGAGSLTFLSSAKYLPEFRASQAAAVLVTQELAAEPLGPRTRIVVDDPHRALREALLALAPEPVPRAGVHPTALIGRGASLGPDVTIGPHALLGEHVRVGARSRLGAGVVLEAGVTVGEDTVLDHHAVCYRGTTIGDRVIIKAGVVLGGPGFGYVPSQEGHLRMPHVGRCIIEDEVEIGSNSCVDRGSIDDTVIGRGSKIDNLVHIAHNVRIGQRCLFMSGVGVAGSVTIGDDAILAGQAGVVHHVAIGSGARVASQAGVTGDLPDQATVSGFPARPHREFMRGQAAMYRLGAILREIETLVRERKRGA